MGTRHVPRYLCMSSPHESGCEKRVPAKVRFATTYERDLSLFVNLELNRRDGGRRRAGRLPAPQALVRRLQVRQHQPHAALPQLLVRPSRKRTTLTPTFFLLHLLFFVGAFVQGVCGGRLLDSLSPPLPPPNHRCYCCDKQAPCADWAVHCDAKSGVQKWVAMRQRIQMEQVLGPPFLTPSLSDIF